MKYNYSAVGGTFDLLHKGHRYLLTKTFLESKSVIIGLTTDHFNQQIGKIASENEKLRRKNLIAFLQKNKLFKRAKIFLLKDIYGPTIKDSSLEAIFVTKDTKRGAVLINQERQKINKPKLKIILVPEVKDKQGKIISSSRIRTGEIDSEGKNLKQVLLKIAGKNLSEKIRQHFKKPLGVIVSTLKKTELQQNIITVGDITTAKFIAAGITPQVAIIDFFVQREQKYHNLGQLGFSTVNPDMEIENPAGQISRNLILGVEKTLKNASQGQIILVEGEEDLATIPAILLSPLGNLVFYGQPKKGLVKVPVTAEIKQKICDILNQ